jgi:hypothetical protein
MRRTLRRLLPALVTLLCLILVELPYSDFVLAYTQDSNMIVKNKTTLGGVENVEASVTMGTNNWPNGYNYTTIRTTNLELHALSRSGPGCISGNVYGQGEMFVSGIDPDAEREAESEPEHYAYGLIMPYGWGGEGPQIAIYMTTGYAQLWGDTGAVGLGDVWTDENHTEQEAHGAIATAKDATSNVTTAVINASTDDDDEHDIHNGHVYIGTMDNSGTTPKPGASIEIDAAGNVIVTLPASGTGDQSGALDKAHANGLGILFPKPDIPTPE